MAVNVDLIGRAEVMKEAGLYDDMVHCMKERVETTPVLSNEERDLLSVAYGNAVGSRLSAWRTVSSAEQKAPDGSDDHQAATWLRERVETEMKWLCRDVLAMLDKLHDKCLIPAPKTYNVESPVFYLKMKGGYYRYLAEISEGKEREDMVCDAEKSYLEAFTMAVEGSPRLGSEPLKPTHPVRLKLALSFSVFYYEIRKNRSKACDMSKKAFDLAIAELDTLSESKNKGSMDMMQQLRDNLTLWTSENEDQEEN